MEPQVVVPPPCSSHSHGCQHHCSSWWTQAGPWAPQSHQRSHGHQHDQGGQVAPHGKSSRSASPPAAAAAGRINTLFAQVVLLLVDPGPRQLTWDTPSSHPITHIDLLICLLFSFTLRVVSAFTKAVWPLIWRYPPPGSPMATARLGGGGKSLGGGGVSICSHPLPLLHSSPHSDPFPCKSAFFLAF